MGTVPILAAQASENGPAPLRPEADGHIFRREAGQRMSQSPAANGYAAPEYSMGRVRAGRSVGPQCAPV